MAKIDTQILIDKIKVADDLVLFKEACKCYLNDSFRAAYIMAWLAIVESLKRRIQEFSNIGDKQAAQEFSKINKLELDKKSADHAVLKAASDLEIIGPEDTIDLEAFLGKRGIYVHPYHLAPNEIEVNYILNKAVEIILSKENRFGKSFFENYIDNTLKIRHSISEKGLEADKVASNIIGRMKPGLYPFILKTLLFEISIKYEDTTLNWYKVRCRRFVLQLLTKVEAADLVNPKWQMAKSATSYPEQFLFAISDKNTWPKIPDDVKDTIFRFIALGEFKQSNYVFLVLSKAIEVIENKYRIILNKICENYQLNESYTHLLLSFEERERRIIKQLKSSNYESQNLGFLWILFGIEEGKDWLGIESGPKIRQMGELFAKDGVLYNWARPSTLVKILEHPTLHQDFVNGYFHAIFFNDESDLHYSIKLNDHITFFKKVNQEHSFNEEVEKVRKRLIELEADDYPTIEEADFYKSIGSSTESNLEGLNELLSIIKIGAEK
jgi:hypothetical protein